MALNFPTNPSNGDTYTDASTTWEYDGVAWNIIPGSSLGYQNSFSSIIGAGSGSVSADVPGDTVTLSAGNNIEITANDSTNTLTISSSASSDYSFNITADDSTQRSVRPGETISFNGGTNITTSSDIEGNITISQAGGILFSSLTGRAGLTIDQIYEQAIVRFSVDNIGTSAYLFQPHYANSNPDLYVISGTTVAFDLNKIPSLPFELQDATQTPLDENLVHVANDGTISLDSAAQGKSSGTLYWRIPESFTGTYRYECQLYPTMFGPILIKKLSLL